MSGKHLVDSWRPWMGTDGQIGGWTLKWTASDNTTEQPTANVSNYNQVHSSSSGTVIGELTFATVRNAGHQVPTFQPQRAQDLFRAFLYDEPLPKPKSKPVKERETATKERGKRWGRG